MWPPRHGGQHSLEALEDVHARLPDTIEQHTGGGGRHLLFAHQEGVRDKTHLAPGLDVRGDGGYIVVAPSIHPSGQAYVWEDASRPGTVPLAPWPPWLVALLLSLRGPQTPLNGQTPLMGEGNP